MTETIKERPILMSAPMVRAILDGSKTQTRRVVDFMKPTADAEYAQHVERHQEKSCKYGTAGDRLWVRETWNRAERTGYDAAPQDGRPGFDESDPDAYNFGPCWYRATDDRLLEGGWKPSIFMPRTASRITLEIVSVRVERLQDISGYDAMCEGVEFKMPAGADPSNQKFPDGFDTWHKQKQDRWFEDAARVTYMAQCVAAERAISSYHTLWESINGPGSWDANPWVWCIEFKKLEAAP